MTDQRNADRAAADRRNVAVWWLTLAILALGEVCAKIIWHRSLGQMILVGIGGIIYAFALSAWVDGFARARAQGTWRKTQENRGDDDLSPLGEMLLGTVIAIVATVPIAAGMRTRSGMSIWEAITDLHTIYKALDNIYEWGPKGGILGLILVTVLLPVGILGAAYVVLFSFVQLVWSVFRRESRKEVPQYLGALFGGALFLLVLTFVAHVFVTSLNEAWNDFMEPFRTIVKWFTD